jgi:glutathione synthase/RimK-type ligase-like ATP-grasp enzyme
MTKLYHPQVRTKNFSSAPLRKNQEGIGHFPVRSIVRLGSVTTLEEAFPISFGRKDIIEINTVEAVENSRSKLLMKQCFAEAGVPQADWWKFESEKPWNLLSQDGVTSSKYLPYPILAKRVFGFKGHGMAKLDNQEQLEAWLSKNNTSGYYFEEFKNYAREYRLHCTQDKCFIVWRKLRKADSENRWFFNSSNCNWVGEEHELFDRPSNWDSIVEDCLKAIRAVGLDLGSFDVRIQSAKKKNPEYIIVEVNSAPSLGRIGIQKYREIITELIENKINNLNK